MWGCALKAPSFSRPREMNPSSSSVVIESEILVLADLLLLDVFSGWQEAVRKLLVYSPC